MPPRRWVGETHRLRQSLRERIDPRTRPLTAEEREELRQWETRHLMSRAPGGSSLGRQFS